MIAPVFAPLGNYTFMHFLEKRHYRFITFGNVLVPSTRNQIHLMIDDFQIYVNELNENKEICV